METIALPTKECRGVDIPDAMGNPTGKVYRARESRPGYIEVNNTGHAKAIRAMLGQDSAVSVGFADVLGSLPCGCGRENWPWQKTCGKCGASLVNARIDA